MPRTGAGGHHLSRPAFTIETDAAPAETVAALAEVLRGEKYRVRADDRSLHARGASNLKTFLADSTGIDALPALKSWGQTAVIDAQSISTDTGSRTRVEFRAADTLREVPRLMAAFETACTALRARGHAVTQSEYAEAKDVPALRQ